MDPKELVKVLKRNKGSCILDMEGREILPRDIQTLIFIN